MLGYVLNLTPCLPWSGFMKTVVRNDEFCTSRIETFPFINLDPSNPSTIYTALCFAQELCEKKALKTCPVTFDQPLFLKASEIVASSSDLDRVIVCLGGLHLLMSYLGSVGQIMTGSELEELWEQVYAKGSVLTGHAFSQAVCAHILTLLALKCFDGEVRLAESDWQMCIKLLLTKMKVLQIYERAKMWGSSINLFHNTYTKLLVKGKLESYGCNESIRFSSCWTSSELRGQVTASSTFTAWGKWFHNFM